MVGEGGGGRKPSKGQGRGRGREVEKCCVPWKARQAEKLLQEGEGKGGESRQAARKQGRKSVPGKRPTQSMGNPVHLSVHVLKLQTQIQTQQKKKAGRHGER